MGGLLAIPSHIQGQELDLIQEPDFFLSPHKIGSISMGPLGPLGPRSLLPSRNHGLEHPPFSSMIGPFECLFCSSRISEKAMFDFRDIIQYTEWWSLGQLCFKIHHREKSSSH
jgi:hypothetical protein